MNLNIPILLLPHWEQKLESGCWYCVPHSLHEVLDFELWPCHSTRHLVSIFALYTIASAIISAVYIYICRRKIFCFFWSTLPPQLHQESVIPLPTQSTNWHLKMIQLWGKKLRTASLPTWEYLWASSCSPGLLTFCFKYRPLLFCGSSNSASAQINRQVSGLYNCLTLARLRRINCGNLLCSYYNSFRLMVALCKKCYVTRTPFGDSKLCLTCIFKYPHWLCVYWCLGRWRQWNLLAAGTSHVNLLGSMIDCAPPHRWIWGQNSKYLYFHGLTQQLGQESFYSKENWKWGQCQQALQDAVRCMPWSDAWMAWAETVVDSGGIVPKFVQMLQRPCITVRNGHSIWPIKLSCAESLTFSSCEDHGQHRRDKICVDVQVVADASFPYLQSSLNHFQNFRILIEWLVNFNTPLLSTT